MAPTVGRTAKAPIITPNLPILQVHALAAAAGTQVKSVKEAKALLSSRGWTATGEGIALETLAKTLFSVALDEKLTPVQANLVTAVAFLLTERLENQVFQDFTEKITEIARSSLETLTSDLQSKLELQLQTITETTHAQTALTENLQQTQERLETTTQQVAESAKTYSQVASSPPNPNNSHPPPQTSLEQIRLRNREEIKKRQVLIDFDRTAELDLDIMDTVTLARKVNDAINTAWAITPEPRPLNCPKLKASTLLRNGGLLLEFDLESSADWLRDDAISQNFLANIGSGASIKNRSYQVIVQFAPVQFSPHDDSHLREYEATNGLDPNSVLKAEWIKKVSERKPAQRVATLRVYHKNATSANTILSKGAYIMGKSTVPKKPKKEPIRCLKCQRYGHERRDCKSIHPCCGLCASLHETDGCTTPKRLAKCANCQGPHPSFDRDCPSFWDKCKQTDSRCLENSLAFYPTDDAWSWATLGRDPHIDPPPPPPNHFPPPGRDNGLFQTTLRGANFTRPGPHAHNQQPHHGHFQ